MKRIFSLNMICYLKCKGYKEVSVGYNDNTRKIYYNFEDNEYVNEAIREYKQSDTVVRLHDFIAEFKRLKDEMYQYSKKYRD